MSITTDSGFQLLPGGLGDAAQRELARAVLSATSAAPFYHPTTPGGRRMSVAMTNLGPLGWVSDGAGYSYAPRHPVTGRPWPPIPSPLLCLWSALIDPHCPPDACLVNRYGPTARMALHQDRDEADFSVPVLSVSLGDTALFRLGGPTRAAPTRSFRLASGDICILSGKSRLYFHGVDRILPDTSTVVPGGGRLNLTLRRARPTDRRAAETREPHPQGRGRPR